MNTRRMFRPDLDECVLEDRLAPVIANLGVIVLTTGGFALLTPFPGAFVSPASLASSSGPPAAAGVSGTPINAPFFIMGSGGLSSVQPGNITGVPSLGLAGLTRAAAGPTSTINLGSGANDASALNIPSVTRNTIANDVLNPPPIIGGQPSGSNSPVLPPGQSYRGTTPTAAPRAATGGQAGASAPPSGVVSTPPTPYPPSVVPLVFPFKPPAGSMIPGVVSPPGSVPGGMTPLPVSPSRDSRQAGPSQSGRE
jgi:hypothetical protein